jgi:hypothetical protein
LQNIHFLKVSDRKRRVVHYQSSRSLFVVKSKGLQSISEIPLSGGTSLPCPWQ